MTKKSETSRRELVAAIGASVTVGALATATESAAQSTNIVKDRRLSQSLHGSVLDPNKFSKRTSCCAADLGKDQR